MSKRKLNLAAEAAELTEDIEVEKQVTEELLLELCPQEFKKAFTKAKTAGQRADFLYMADKYRLECRKEVEAQKKFISNLEKWFIQQLPESDATGISGEVACVKVQKKSRPNVKEWDKFYEHIHKNKAFELLNRAVNVKSVKERWEEGKEVPGVEKFEYKDVSVTKVK